MKGLHEPLHGAIQQRRSRETEERNDKAEGKERDDKIEQRKVVIPKRLAAQVALHGRRSGFWRIRHYFRAHFAEERSQCVGAMRCRRERSSPVDKLVSVEVALQRLKMRQRRRD